MAKKKKAAVAVSEEKPLSDKVRPKEFKGQRFVQTKSPAAVKREIEEKTRAKKDPDVVAIDAYFSMKGISDPVCRAAMRAYTTSRFATYAEFEDIFSTF